MDQAFSWVKSNGGLCAEDDYKYRGSQGYCQKSCEKKVTVSGHRDVPRSERALMSAISGQPVSVAINAMPIQHYHGGVFDQACSPDLDHGVLAVGYGTDPAGKDYWKIKNSWGGGWGEGGYIRIWRENNLCGVQSSASYPTGATAASGGGSGGGGPAPAPPPPPIFDCRKVKAKPECDQHDHLPYDKCNWCEVTAKNGSWAGCLAPWEIQQLPTGFTCDV